MDGIQNLGVYSLGAVGISRRPGPNSLYGLSGASHPGPRLSARLRDYRHAGTLSMAPVALLFLYFSLQLFGATL